MIFPRYLEYKNTGLAWAKRVPAHWAIKRLRFVAQLNPSKSEVAEVDRAIQVSFLPMDAIGDDGWLNLERTRPISEVESGYTYFRNGDVTLAKITPCFENGKGALMQGLEGGIGFGTTELIVARPNPTEVTGKLLSWIFRSPNFRAQGEASMYGAGGQKRVPDDFVRDFAWAFPPLGEQTSITAFLDRETAKIDALIAEQEKLIALLAEKRQATISHAVTRGLNPNASMKDSGVAWLGKVPAHWSVIPLKYLVDLRSGGTPSKENLTYWNGDVPWASAKDLKVERLEGTLDRITQKAVDDGAANIVDAGAVLVVVRGMILARMFPVVETLVPMAINQDLKALLPRDGLSPTYLAWLLRGSADESLQRLDEAGHGTKALRMDAWISMNLPIPPLEEQIQLNQFILRATQKLDVLRAQAEQAIGLLHERRSALIAAAVTGPPSSCARCTLPSTSTRVGGPAESSGDRGAAVCRAHSGGAASSIAASRKPFIASPGSPWRRHHTRSQARRHGRLVTLTIGAGATHACASRGPRAWTRTPALLRSPSAPPG